MIAGGWRDDRPYRTDWLYQRFELISDSQLDVCLHRVALFDDSDVDSVSTTGTQLRLSRR